ncbi:type II toxin-antitoxin system VapC family toxin [Microbacterium hominis]|uniref:Ribonuclease VapC n=1 Tax=Microbacterium hominis TaxID=162426 RepID=A0A7D4Q151_9MICO|nr:type II toxin-antitoxin system VapC family toxin [Microbacterium hominis]QKJ18631.1 type II toxin-antitoxin system VapC family toxin [Microbacterium hominis]
MRIIDTNVLVYAVDARSPQHAASIAWLDSALDGRDDVGFSWNALLGFIRLTTNPRVFPSPLAAEEAMAQVHDWLAAPSAHVLNPGARHPEILERLLVARGAAGNLVNDAHLAALAIENRASVVTFDSDLSRFEGVRAVTPDDLLRRAR